LVCSEILDRVKNFNIGFSLRLILLILKTVKAKLMMSNCNPRLLPFKLSSISIEKKTDISQRKVLHGETVLPLSPKEKF